MKKTTVSGSRLIAICLALALLCGMLPVGVLAAEPQAASGSYTLAAAIEPGKSYVLVADGQYALNNTAVTYGNYSAGTDTLGSTAVTVEGDKIVSEVDESLLWTIEEGTGVPTAPIYDETQYFLYDCNGDQLMRRSGSTATAPLQVGGSYSRIHYITISFYQRADGSYTVFFNTDRSDDYPFSFTASAEGVNAPGVAQSSWDPETYGSSFKLYALAEGGEEGGEEECAHAYEAAVTAPTCLAGGYTTYTCSKCGDSYVADETVAAGHDYQDGVCSVCGAAQPAQGGLVDIDFTDPASADQFDILNQASTEIREGQGLYMVTTREAFEPCNGQISTFAPKDVVKVPVGGNWTATLKFTFDPAGAQNGYYQFFGFYASEGEDYNKLAGIRGGDGAYQNFLRTDADTINADNNNSEPGLATAGTYWWRIVKDDTTYTCYRSENGEDFAEMFTYDETGIEADALVLDAYTGLTEGYTFYVESLEFEGGAAACQHNYKTVVTEPTCLEGGYTTQTCSLCGKERVTNKTAALGHEWDEGVTTKEPTQTEAGEKTVTCTRCGETKTQRIPPLNDAPNPYQLLFTSDLHAGLDGYDGFHNLKALLPLLKEEGLNPAVFTNGGDYVEDSYGSQANWPVVFEALYSIVNTTYPEIGYALTLGNHDWEWNQMSDAKFKEISGFDRTGMNYANDLYEIYQIGAQGNTTAGVDKEIFWDEDIEAFDAYLESKVGSGKVIFVQTHWPLHRGYNWHWRTVTNAGKMIDTMNKYGDDLDIVFLWGHNHYTDEMRNTIVQRGGSISYAENQSKTIKFTYASVGCMNDMYYLHSGHRDTMQGHGVCLSGELQDDTLVLTYNRIDDAYKTVGEGVLTHNANLTLSQSNTVLQNPAVVEVQLYNVEGSDIEIPECEHSYKDGVCTKCGEEDPNYVPDEPVEGDYVLAETVEAGKQYVVVSNGYALTNKTASVSTANGGTSLGATAVTVKDGIITSEVTPDMIWDVSEGTTTQADHPYDGYFVTNAGSKFLSRGSSGGAGVAPLNTETYDASNVSSKPHYAYWSVEDLDGTTKNMFLYSTSSSDYVFFLRGAAEGFDAPGTAQDSWQSAKASYPVEFYEIVEGGDEPVCEHDYKAVVTDPTCEEGGYTTYTCSKCGDSYVADETAKLGHDYKDGVCTVCGGKDPNYVPDEPEVPGDGEYVLATSIEAGKTYVLVADGQYALNNTAVTYGSYGNGTDTLGSTAVTIEGDKIVSEVDDSMLWTVELGEDVPASPIYDEVQYFLYDCDGNQLMRRSGSSGTAPLQAGGTYSRIHYVTISFHERADGSYTVFFNTDRTDDYPFSFSGSASGFNAPGTAQDSWDIESYGSSIRLYEAGEACEHDYKAVVTAPTCTEKGYTTYTCELCGHSYVGNETETVKHTFKKGVCTVCGAEDPDYVPVEGNYVLADTIEAGKQYIVVSNGYALTNVTANVSTANGGISLGSTPVTVEDGVITSEVTPDMIWDFSEGSTTQADHPYSDGFFLTNGDSKYLSRASSGGNGVAPLNTETYDASNVDTKSHYNYWTIADVDGSNKSMFLYSTTSSDYVFFLRGGAEGFDSPGTSQDGWQSYMSTYQVQFYEVTGGDVVVCEHDYKAVVTDPTCTEDGYTTYTCSKCGKTYKDDYVDALGHDYEEVVTAPTCTEKGYTTYTCSVCGDSYKGNETAALDHKWDGGVVTKEATKEEDGIRTFTCTVCDETKTEVIPKLKDDHVHDYAEVVTAPTCTERGYTTYTCSCGDSYKADYVDVIAHDYKDGVCTVCGAKDENYHECPSAIFSDVPGKEHWAHEGIDYAVENGLMKGVADGKFNPGGTLTRAELVTILYREAGSPEVEYKGIFEDVADDQWYTDAVEWAATNKIVNGVGDGTNFAPSDTITREQIATILYRYSGEPEVKGDLKAFPDANKVSSFATVAMAWAVENKIITGASVNDVTYLKPLDSATREQIASIIMRYLEGE